MCWRRYCSLFVERSVLCDWREVGLCVSQRSYFEEFEALRPRQGYRESSTVHTRKDTYRNTVPVHLPMRYPVPSLSSLRSFAAPSYKEATQCAMITGYRYWNALLVGIGVGGPGIAPLRPPVMWHRVKSCRVVNRSRHWSEDKCCAYAKTPHVQSLCFSIVGYRQKIIWKHLFLVCYFRFDKPVFGTTETWTWRFVWAYLHACRTRTSFSDVEWSLRRPQPRADTWECQRRDTRWFSRDYSQKQGSISKKTPQKTTTHNQSKLRGDS